MNPPFDTGQGSKVLLTLDFSGICLFVLDDPDWQGGKTKQVDVLFPSKRVFAADGLCDHVPILSYQATELSGTSGPLEQEWHYTAKGENLGLTRLMPGEITFGGLDGVTPELVIEGFGAVLALEEMTARAGEVEGRHLEGDQLSAETAVRVRLKHGRLSVHDIVPQAWGIGAVLSGPTKYKNHARIVRYEVVVPKEAAISSVRLHHFGTDGHASQLQFETLRDPLQLSLSHLCGPRKGDGAGQESRDPLSYYAFSAEPGPAQSRAVLHPPHPGTTPKVDGCSPAQGRAKRPGP
jgi:hypothetical protein